MHCPDPGAASCVRFMSGINHCLIETPLYTQGLLWSNVIKYYLVVKCDEATNMVQGVQMESHQPQREGQHPVNTGSTCSRRLELYKC